MANVTHELLAQIADRVEPTALDHLALQLREPNFNLVKPGRGSGRKMERDIGVLDQEGIDQPGFMSRKIVGNDVDRLGRRLGSYHLEEKANKLGAGVAGAAVWPMIAPLPVSKAA